MANKYIDVSATYNGDGTASNQAASAGATGAWNSFLNPAKNTPGYGSVDAGDKIFVRTKNSVDLGEVAAAAVTMVSVATSAVPTEWVFDDGTIWPGYSGQFTVTMPGVTFICANYNHFYAGDASDRRLRFLNTHSLTTQIQGVQYGIATYCGVLFDCSPVASNSTRQVYYNLLGNTVRAKLVDCYWNMYSVNALGAFPVLAIRDNSGYDLINPIFNFNGATRQCYIHGTGIYGYVTTIKGGKVLGAITGQHFLTTLMSAPTFVSRVEIDGFDLGAAGLSTTYLATGSVREFAQTLFTSRVNPFDFIYLTNNGMTEWWDYQNYPTLNATLPNGRAWSARVTPSGSSPGSPAVYAKTNKLFTLASAVKTITAELLIQDTYTNPTAKEFWIEVTYINSDGDSVSLSSFSQDASALQESSATWSTVLFGDPAKTFNKFKISITTPTAIRQYSQIQISLVVGRAPLQPTDYLFIDPDFTVS